MGRTHRPEGAGALSATSAVNTGLDWRGAKSSAGVRSQPAAAKKAMTSAIRMPKNRQAEASVPLAEPRSQKENGTAQGPGGGEPAYAVPLRIECYACAT